MNRTAIAFAAMLLALATPHPAAASWCATQRAGSGLLVPLKSPTELVPAATDAVELKWLDVAMRRGGQESVVRYRLHNHGPARELTVAVPLIAARDGDADCASLPLPDGATRLRSRSKVLSGRLVPLADAEPAEIAAVWGYPYDALLVVTLPFEAGRGNELEHHMPAHFLRVDSPSAYGNVSRAVRWPMHGLAHWRGGALRQMEWELDVGKANHCLATAQPGATFDDEKGRLRWRVRGLSASDPAARTGLYAEWEPPLPTVDAVYLARGEHADDIFPIFDALLRREDPAPAIAKRSDADLRALYEGFLDSYRLRWPEREVTDDLQCQEVTVGEFREIVERKLTTLAGGPAPAVWPGPRTSAPPLRLSLFQGASVMKALAAALHARGVSHTALPPK